MGNISCALRRPRQRKNSENASSTDKTHSSQGRSIQSDVQSDPGASATRTTQSEVQPDPQPSESDWSVHFWYRHTGEDPPSDDWRMSAGKLINTKEIREDIGEHHITHLKIVCTLPPSLKDIAPKLTHLRVSHLMDHSLLGSLRELEELTELDLVRCRLRDLPDKFGELQQLEKLSLMKNNFSRGLPDVITKLSSLTSLDLCNCFLPELPERFGELQQLEKLSLKKNKFPRGLPDVITKLSSLTSLDLCGCYLTELPERFGELQQLEKLSLMKNNFSRRLPDVITKLSSLTSLDLCDCYLTELPERFGELQQLESLSLSVNRFSSGLPDVITKLSSLTSLDLRDCSLTELPERFGELRQLEELDLGGTKFSDGLPNEITKLGSLTKLKLDKCHLTDLPQRFGELQQLESLSLMKNDFSSGLPDVITKLSSLTSLDLRDCSLTELPERFSELRQLEKLDLETNDFPHGLPDEITKLGSLTELNLDDCYLTDLPQRFGELQQLESLSLSGSRFSSGLPDVITKLSSLTSLDLRDCSLTELPERMGNLENLWILSLQSNRFVEVPPAVLDLKELGCLNLSDNSSLSEIDEKVLQLKNLDQLDCDGCPSLRSPPYQVCKQGIVAIRSYFVELAKGEEVSTIPVAIIGNPCSGKTSIVRSLKEGKRELTDREPSSLEDEITKVFNVEKLKFPKCHVRLIDHGGQEIYHIAYHLALKEQCIPLIVVNIFDFFKKCSSGDIEEATRDVCFDWLCHLYLSRPNLGRPLLALTHTDKFLDDDEALENSKVLLKETVENIRSKWLEEEKQCEKESQGKFTSIQHLSNPDVPIFLEEDIFEFNNDTNITSNIERLKENIGGRCEVLERKIPQSWEEVSAFLEKASDKPYMQLSAIEEKFRDRDYKTILEYMHNTGKILWFQQNANDGDNELYPYIFHQVPAITKVVSLLLHQSKEKTERDSKKNFIPYSYEGNIIDSAKYQELSKKFLRTGVLDEALLHNLLVNELQFDSKVAVKLLKCFRIVHGPVELTVSKKPRNVYTVPSVAKKPMDHSWKTDGRLQLRLDIKFRGLPLPEYAYHIASVSVLTQAEQFNIVDARSNGVIVKHGGNATYLCHDPKARKVTLQVSSSVEKLSDSWVRLRDTAKDITDVISNRWKASRFEVIHYCTHCLFLRDTDFECTVDPEWFEESFTYDGLDLVACYKGKDLTVPKPLMFPCSNFSSDEITSLDSYLKELQSTHACST